MTLIDKAEALALIDRKVGKNHPALADELHHAIAALPARGVGVLDKTLLAKKADDARGVFDGTCDSAKQAVDYFEQLLLAAITEAGQ